MGIWNQLNKNIFLYFLAYFLRALYILYTMLSPNSTFLLVESPFLWAPQIPKSPWLPGSHLCHLLRWADVPRDLEPDTWNWQWDGGESDPKLCQSPAGDAKTLRIAGNPAMPETSGCVANCGFPEGFLWIHMLYPRPRCCRSSRWKKAADVSMFPSFSIRSIA